MACYALSNPVLYTDPYGLEPSPHAPGTVIVETPGGETRIFGPQTDPAVIDSFINGHPGSKVTRVPPDGKLPEPPEAVKPFMTPPEKAKPSSPGPGLTDLGGAVAGADAHFFVGGGGATVFCKDKNCKLRVMTFYNLCIGGAVGAAYTPMLVNMSGENCEPSSFEGWFFESGVSAGIVGVGWDLGYSPMEPGSMFPGAPNGIVEGGAGPSYGGQIKATWCYYWLASDITV